MRSGDERRDPRVSDNQPGHPPSEEVGMTLREILLLDISRRVAANRPMGEIANSVLGAIEARVRRLEAADHTLVLLDGTLVVPVDEVRRVILGRTPEACPTYFAAVLTGIVLGILILLLGGPPWAALGFGYLAFQVVRANPRADEIGPRRGPWTAPRGERLIRLGRWRIRGVRAKWKGITEEAIEAALAERPNTRIPSPMPSPDHWGARSGGSGTTTTVLGAETPPGRLVSGGILEDDSTDCLMRLGPFLVEVGTGVDQTVLEIEECEPDGFIHFARSLGLWDRKEVQG